MILPQVNMTCGLLALLVNLVTAGSGTWKNLTDIPHARQEHSTVALDDNTIAVVGGILPILNGTEQIGLDTTDLLELYDISTGAWSTRTAIPFKVNHPNAAVAGGKLYLLGGLVDVDPTSADVAWEASGESYVYDPSTDSWSQLATMPPGTERGSSILGVYGELIYVAAGMTTLTVTYQDSITTVTVYNITADEWQRVEPAAAQIPEGRQHAVGGVVGDNFYVIGGRWFGQTGTRGTVYVLNLLNTTACWTTGPNLMPTPRGGLSGAAVDDTWYTFGGEGDTAAADGVFPNSESYQIASETWTELNPMAVPRHGTSAAAIGNTIYIPGGGLQQDGVPVLVNGVEQYFHSTNHFDSYTV